MTSWIFLEDCEIVKVTDDAILVRPNAGEDEEFWFPKSQMEDPSRLEEGDKGVTVGITPWIAKQKGIEE